MQPPGIDVDRLFALDADRRAPALRRRGVSLTYGELETEVGRLARWLGRHRGVIAVRARNDIPSVIVILAALRRGLPVALLSPSWTEPELSASRASLGRAVEIATDGTVLWKAAPSAPVVHHPEAAVALFTSGSTGRPRAVQLSRAHLQHVVTNVVTSLGLDHAREQAVFVPLTHALGLVCQLLPGLWAGMATHLLDGVTDARTEIEHGRARGVWAAVPAQWDALLRFCRDRPDQVAGITHVVSAGAPLGEGLRRRLRDRFASATLYNGYGLTEAPRVVGMSSGDPRFLSAATGVPMPGTEIRLGPDGELYVRGPGVMLGYLGMASDDQRLRDGYLHTGDAAHLDASGLITVTGRLDDLHKVGGDLISLCEVDDELRSLTDVRDAAAAVLEDDARGATLVGFLVGGTALRHRCSEELREELAQRLAWCKVPRRFFVVDALPRTGSGKLQRTALLSCRHTEELGQRAGRA